MIFIDTGYFVAITIAKDQHHESAIQWMLTLRDTLVVTEHVLVETVNALAKFSMRAQAIDIADTVRTKNQFRWVSSTPDLLDAGLSLFISRPDKQWSLTNCVSFGVMRQMNITRALAHDHHFEQAGFEALLRRNP